MELPDYCQNLAPGQSMAILCKDTSLIEDLFVQLDNYLYVPPGANFPDHFKAIHIGRYLQKLYDIHPEYSQDSYQPFGQLGSLQKDTLLIKLYALIPNKQILLGADMSAYDPEANSKLLQDFQSSSVIFQTTNPLDLGLTDHACVYSEEKILFLGRASRLNLSHGLECIELSSTHERFEFPEASFIEKSSDKWTVYAKKSQLIIKEAFKQDPQLEDFTIKPVPLEKLLTHLQEHPF